MFTSLSISVHVMLTVSNPFHTNVVGAAADYDDDEATLYMLLRPPTVEDQEQEVLKLLMK